MIYWIELLLELDALIGLEDTFGFGTALDALKTV